MTFGFVFEGKNQPFVALCWVLSSLLLSSVCKRMAMWFLLSLQEFAMSRCICCDCVSIVAFGTDY